ncbi:hypothetical protein J6590_052421 [Homalodisca vitripennis]|nr:hypothetical protein J6590_052421 [Homalodisca vitripennis]
MFSEGDHYTESHPCYRQPDSCLQVGHSPQGSTLHLEFQTINFSPLQGYGCLTPKCGNLQPIRRIRRGNDGYQLMLILHDKTARWKCRCIFATAVAAARKISAVTSGRSSPSRSPVGYFYT